MVAGAQKYLKKVVAEYKRPPKLATLRVNTDDEARRTQSNRIFALNGGLTVKSIKASAQPGHAAQTVRHSVKRELRFGELSSWEYFQIVE